MNGSAPNLSATGSQVCTPEKAQAEFSARGAGVNPELVDQQNGDQEDAGRKNQGDQMRDLSPSSQNLEIRRALRWGRRGDCSGSPSEISYFTIAICFSSLATTGLGSGA